MSFIPVVLVAVKDSTLRRVVHDIVVRLVPDVRIVDWGSNDPYSGWVGTRADALVLQSLDDSDTAWIRRRTQMHPTPAVLIGRRSDEPLYTRSGSMVHVVRAAASPVEIEMTVRRALAAIGQDRPALAWADGSRRLAVGQGINRRMLDLEEIVWIGADGNCVQLHLHGQVLRHRIPLAGLLPRLEQHGFIRVHRSAVVNMSEILEVVSARTHGERSLRMTNGDGVMVSRTYVAPFRTALERYAGARAPGRVGEAAFLGGFS